MHGAVVISANTADVAAKIEVLSAVHALFPIPERVEVQAGEVSPYWASCDKYEMDEGESNSQESRYMVVVGLAWLLAHRHMKRPLFYRDK